MQDNTEYQIFIGCHDSQICKEVVSEDELKTMIVSFFEKNKIDFSMFSAKGGYIYADSSFIYENSLCINIIGKYDLDIIKLAKSLSMFMNQECSLVIKNVIKSELR